MTDETAALLAKAERSIAAASTLLRTGDADFAASRAYYAMFYTAEALLLARGLTFSNHSSVHAAFGKHFARTSALDPEFHRWLLEAFTARIAGDYATGAVLDAGDVEEMIRRAEILLRTARELLEDGPASG